ncbi:MAG TPA: zinc-ribbon domain-containing protein [Terriglobales bacterium]|nr:zinc-ribbon domain-containing protein [Terriglobales bacterium]
MPISCPQCRAEMPDGAAFCPGCGRRMWVPGQEPSKPATKRSTIAPVNLPAENPPDDTIPVGAGDNLLAALAYITFIPAVVFVLIEPLKRNRFIRFHSFQSIFLAVATIVVAIALRILYSVLAVIPVVGYLLGWLALAVVPLGWVILWLVLVVKALQGATFKLPVIGTLAEKA